jgi:DNA-3-methyladenine glycosylase I
MPRCPWATTEPAIAYHDEEWGVPVHDDRTLFEFLILEGAQAGLSWITILKKRENYRKAFDQFRAAKIARYGARDVKRLLADAGIVRNRLKIAATIQNAKAFLAVQEERGSFAVYLWSFVGGKPKQNRWRRMAQVPARTAESDAMSRELLRRAWSTITW